MRHSKLSPGILAAMALGATFDEIFPPVKAPPAVALQTGILGAFTREPIPHRQSPQDADEQRAAAEAKRARKNAARLRRARRA